MAGLKRKKEDRTGRIPRGRAGFTLLELIVVLSILAILLSIALPNYRGSVLQAREAVLRENLYRMRDLIDQYQSDKGRYPESLQSLVTDGYVRSIPVDPMSPEPWTEIPPETDSSNQDILTGVFDVKSSSTQVGTNGVAYSEW
ncbi:MAG: type II secretion system protein [Vicinamibacteria bacterium]|nr:type II secretion system protein [Vicinamibacteria bacterium]